MVLSTAVGPGLSGWLIDLGISYPVMISVMAGYALLAAVCAIFIARVAGRRFA